MSDCGLSVRVEEDERALLEEAGVQQAMKASLADEDERALRVRAQEEAELQQAMEASLADPGDAGASDAPARDEEAQRKRQRREPAATEVVSPPPPPPPRPLPSSAPPVRSRLKPRRPVLICTRQAQEVVLGRATAKTTLGANRL